MFGNHAHGRDVAFALQRLDKRTIDLRYGEAPDVRATLGQRAPGADKQPGSGAVQTRNVAAVQLDVLAALKVEMLQRRIERGRFVDDPVTAENQAQSGVSALGPVPGARGVLGNFAQSLPPRIDPTSRAASLRSEERRVGKEWRSRWS